MKHKYKFTVVLLLLIAVISYALTYFYVERINSDEENDGGLTVVTSFYPVYIAALNVIDGAENVSLENLSEPQTGCLHDYQLTPDDMKLLQTADIFLVNGGGIESFLSDVAEENQRLSIEYVSDGIDFLYDGDEENAHVWMSIANYEKTVQNISEYMQQADPDNSAVYIKNAEAYEDKLEELRSKEDELSNSLKGADKKTVLLQESFEYLADELGLAIEYEMDLDEERQISAGEVADATSAVRDSGAGLVLTDELYGKELAETIKKETGVTVCIVDPCVRGDYDKDSYINAMNANLQNIAEAFESEN